MTDESGEYEVRLIDLPESVGAMVVVDGEGFANVYINARLSYDGRWEAVKHELLHVDRDDAYNGIDIRDVEHG